MIVANQYYMILMEVNKEMNQEELEIILLVRESVLILTII